MHNFDWDDVRIFLAIVQSGSLSQAAEALEINQSTVSRRISALEQRLEVPLFERQRGSRWAVTAAGEQMLAAAEQMNDSANMISREVLRNSTELQGHVSVTIPDIGARHLAAPALAALGKRYPELRLTINVSNETLDLASREADVALRIADTVPSNLLATRICTVSLGIYATARWHRQFADGETRLPLITWMKDEDLAGRLSDAFPDGYVHYRSNNTQTMVEMARQGLGVAPLSCFEARAVPELLRFEQFPILAGPGLWIISHTDLRTTARVRLVRDTLVERFHAVKDQIEIEP